MALLKLGRVLKTWGERGPSRAVSATALNLRLAKYTSHPFTQWNIITCSQILFYFLKDFIYLFIFRERGRRGEREGEKHQYVVASHVAPTEDLTGNPGVSPDWELNQ